MAAPPVPKSVLKFLLSDQALWYCLAVPALAWSVYVIVRVTGWRFQVGPGESVSLGFLLGLAVASCVICLPLGFWRARQLYRLRSRGVIVAGHITKVGQPFRGLVRLEVTYTVDGFHCRDVPLTASAHYHGRTGHVWLLASRERLRECVILE